MHAQVAVMKQDSKLHVLTCRGRKIHVCLEKTGEEAPTLYVDFISFLLYFSNVLIDYLFPFRLKKTKKNLEKMLFCPFSLLYSYVLCLEPHTQ